MLESRLVMVKNDHAHPKNFQSSFNHPANNQLVPSVLSWDTVNVRVQRPDWPHSFLTMPYQKLLIFVNLYQHAKNEAVSLIYSGEMLDLKILQSEWLRAFWPISHEKHFSHIDDLYRNTANNVCFHYRTTSGKIIWQKIWHAQLDKVF